MPKTYHMADEHLKATAKGQPFADELTPQQVELLSRLADRIVKLRMTTPAILFLESVRPMNFVGSQVMVFFSPLVHGFLNLPEWDELRLILERRESIGRFLDIIESKESDWMIAERQRRASTNKLKAKSSWKLWRRRTKPKLDPNEN